MYEAAIEKPIDKMNSDADGATIPQSPWASRDLAANANY